MNTATNNELSTNDQIVTGHGARIEGVTGFMDSACKVGGLCPLHGPEPTPELDHHKQWSNGINAVCPIPSTIMNTIQSKGTTPKTVNNQNNGRQTAPNVAASVPVNQDEDEGFIDIDENDRFTLGEPQNDKAPDRLKGDYRATITKIKKKLQGKDAKQIIRFFFFFELDHRHLDGSPFGGSFNRVKCWKEKSKYRELAAQALGRPLTKEEIAEGINPQDLIGKALIVNVREHRKKASADAPESITLKVHGIKAATELSQSSDESQVVTEQVAKAA